MRKKSVESISKLRRNGSTVDYIAVIHNYKSKGKTDKSGATTESSN